MKNMLLPAAAALATCFLAPSSAQTITITAPDYSATPLFSTARGFSITGLAADENGDVYYLQSDGSFATSTVLYKRTAASGYAEPAGPLFDLGSAVFGSFVKIGGGRIVLGENSTNQLFALNLDGSGADLLGTVAGNYDAAFTMSESLLVSHNGAAFPSAANVVSNFTLLPDGGGGQELSAEDIVLDTVSDYSGSIALDADGSLYYGATAFNGIADLYRYSASEVASATGPVALTLDGSHRVLANGVNGYLAINGTAQLWHTDFSSLNVIDTGTATATQVATSDRASFSISHLDTTNGMLVTNVTDFSDFSNPRSSVYAVVPEPATGALHLVAGLSFACRRRH
ncbi:MAG: hypothetical protein ABI680_01645 [Chthoniobacteraceae bacterium]